MSLLTLAAGAFPKYTARNLFAVGLMVPDLYAGRAITSGDSVHPTKRSLTTRSKGIPPYNVNLAFTPSGLVWQMLRLK